MFIIHKSISLYSLNLFKLLYILFISFLLIIQYSNSIESIYSHNSNSNSNSIITFTLSGSNGGQQLSLQSNGIGTYGGFVNPLVN